MLGWAQAGLRQALLGTEDLANELEDKSGKQVPGEGPGVRADHKPSESRRRNGRAWQSGMGSGEGSRGSCIHGGDRRRGARLCWVTAGNCHPSVPHLSPQGLAIRHCKGRNSKHSTVFHALCYGLYRKYWRVPSRLSADL